MRLLVLADDVVCGVPITWKAQAEGHTPQLYVKHRSGPCGQGLVPLVDSYGSGPLPDLVVATGREFPEAEAFYRKKGVPFNGPGPKANLLETDRAHGLRVLEKAGIETPPWKGFHDLGEAERFAKGYGKPLVMKPNGTKAGSFQTYVAKSDNNADLLPFMRKAVDLNKEMQAKGWILQEKVEGIEIAAGAYFNGKTFVKPITINFENKSFAPPPWTGPSTGEMGTHLTLQYTPKLFLEVTEKMTGHLQEIDYRGCFDVNCILTKQGPMALEHTPRLGFPSLCLEMSACRSSFVEFMRGVATGETALMPTIDRWVVGVLLTTMPFPYEDLVKQAEMFAGMPIEGEFSRHLYPVDVQMLNGGYATGQTGYVAVACGVAPTCEEAKADAYKRLRRLRVPYSYCRTDISDRLHQDREELEKRGYL